jgi:hypothetical protein
MLWSQLILVAVLAGIAVYLVRSQPSARHLALRRLTVFIALIAGVVVVLSPGLLTAVANVLGIGRGTDLLVYASIIAFILYTVSDYKKTVVLNRTQTELARAVTLAEARLEDRLREERGPRR